VRCCRRMSSVVTLFAPQKATSKQQKQRVEAYVSKVPGAWPAVPIQYCKFTSALSFSATVMKIITKSIPAAAEMEDFRYVAAAAGNSTRTTDWPPPFSSRAAPNSLELY
jgi:hypothetical protein